MPGAINKGTAGIAVNQADDTPTLLYWRSGGSDEENQQTGTGLGRGQNGVVGEGLSKEGTSESSVMGRCQPLQDLGEEALNNTVSGGTTINIRSPLLQMCKLRPGRLNRFLRGQKGNYLWHQVNTLKPQLLPPNPLACSF